MLTVSSNQKAPVTVLGTLASATDTTGADSGPVDTTPTTAQSDTQNNGNVVGALIGAAIGGGAAYLATKKKMKKHKVARVAVVCASAGVASYVGGTITERK